MNRNSLYIIFLSALVIAGCQKNETNPDYAGSYGIVKFMPSITGTGVLSKAQSDANTSSRVYEETILAAEDGTLSIPMTRETSAEIGLNTFCSESITTKGELINENGPDVQPFATDKSFYVKAWDAGTSANIIPGTAAGSYQQVTYSDSQWSTSNEYYWKSGETKTFYAYANLPSSGASVANVSAASQTLTYAVPATASTQTDILMGCYSGDGKTGDPAKMTGTASIVFSHPLTAVKFKLGTIEGVTSFVINSISIEGVYASGTAEMTPTTAAQSDPKNRFTWTPEGSTTVSQTVSTQPTTEKPAIGEAFLLIPQAFTSTSTARIAISCTIDGVDRTLYWPLASAEWKAGYTNTYTVGYDNNLELNPPCFSVSPTKKVYFSKGNLYWDGSVFKFETNQLDYQTEWDASHVNLFYYSKDVSVAYDETYNDPEASTSDVFFTNANSNPSTPNPEFTVNGETGTWMTLSPEEWGYLFSYKVKYGLDYSNETRDGLNAIYVLVDGVKCAVLYPDGYDKSKVVENNDETSYDTAEKRAAAEAEGIVFLPAAGIRNGSELTKLNKHPYYWTSSPVSSDTQMAYCATFADGFRPNTDEERYKGYSVRLVTEVK